MLSEFVWISKIDQKKKNVVSDKFHWLIFGAELCRGRMNAPFTFMPNFFQLHTVADTGFPRRERADPGVWGKNPSFGKICAQNCMKVEEIGPGGFLDLPMIG